MSASFFALSPRSSRVGRLPRAASIFFVLSLGVGLAACSSSSDAGTPSDGGGIDTGAPSGDTAPGPDTGGDTASGALAFKTYVILGDSISDGGGEAPFFYDLLDKNDDTKWPDYTGQDLETKYPGIKIVKASKGGATAVNLQAAIAALPTSLDGPVLVTITIGGNDVQAALPALLTGGTDDAKRAQFQGYISDSLDQLTKADRFGAGVKVHIIMTNIYDPSDGTGNFTFASGTKCGGALGFWPASKPTKPLLDNWEDIMTTEAAKHPEVALVDLRARFTGHGVPDAETWFFSDCIHPNALGHNQVRGLVWDSLKTL